MCDLPDNVSYMLSAVQYQEPFPGMMVPDREEFHKCAD